MNGLDELMEYEGLSIFGDRFIAIRSKVRAMACQKHHRKAFLDHDYTGDSESGFETHIYITRYCCHEFAQEVKQFIEKAEVADTVEIEKP